MIQQHRTKTNIKRLIQSKSTAISSLKSLGRSNQKIQNKICIKLFILSIYRISLQYIGSHTFHTENRQVEKTQKSTFTLNCLASHVSVVVYYVFNMLHNFVEVLPKSKFSSLQS